MNQRVVFTSGGVEVSRDARNCEITRRDNELRIAPEWAHNYWPIDYESEKEARQAFNLVNGLLAGGNPVVYVPGPGFMKESEED